MYPKKIKIICGALIGATLVITFFILLNSFLDFSASHKLSGMIMKWLFPNAKVENGVVDDFWLRKAAHLLEYALLGTSFGGVITFLKRQFSKYYIGTALFVVLIIAVIDEFIQGFNGRNSSAADVLLDFCGAIIGFGLVIFVIWIVNCIKSRKKNKKAFAYELYS